MPTMTDQLRHKWVKHTITDVATLPDLDDDRQVVVIEDPADVKIAEANAVYGCNACGVALEGNIDTECDPMCHCGVSFSQHGPSDNHSPVEMR